MPPLSGSVRPFAILSKTLFPLEAGPRIMRISPEQALKLMFVRTGLPSKPMETSTKRMAASCSAVAVSDRLARMAVFGMDMALLDMASTAEDANHDSADDKIRGDDHDRTDHDRLGSGTAYALGSPARGH